MADGISQGALPVADSAAAGWGAALLNAARAAGPPLLFGLRLWAAVCLALYIAFWLQLDSPSWAGTTAAIVCQPSLGASLRKGWFRMIGTPIGGVAIVVLTACFPQDRTVFLITLALWGAACAFASTLLQNYTAYAAALSGYTAVIIASDQLGATGGLNGEAFTLAITRVTEIGIGIVSAGIVLAGTDLGDARRQLAALFAGLAAGIMARFTGALQAAGSDQPDTQSIRRDFIRRVIALDPIIDQAIGESSQIRYHSPVLQKSVDGLFAALSGWRAIANHLVRLPDDQARAEAATVLQSLSPRLISLPDQPAPAAWTADPIGLHKICEAGVHRLIALEAETPSQRLLADKAAEGLAGMACALNGLALLAAEPARPVLRGGVFRLHVTDWLPAVVSAGRTFVTILAVAWFWIVTAWPSGAEAITWAAIPTILFAPRADQAYASARGFVAGAFIAAVAAAVVAFAVLPNLDTFAAFSFAIGLWLIPAGAVAHQWRKVAFVYMAAYFMPVLAPVNQMSYDTAAFYNTATAIISGAGAAALAFCLIPPLSPAFRTHRLLALTLRDLRRLAMERTFTDWAGHIHGRLSAMPEQATPLQRAQLLAVLSLGTEIIRLRPIARRFGFGPDLEDALAAVAEGRSVIAIARLKCLDEALDGLGTTETAALSGRGSILVVSEVLTKHPEYFDIGVKA
ncbi:FUSC family protein [Bradyrhizobium sp.]|jgi:uncharacterized membrane protein YccC|uniref:FUSC family protein n=1 Tax=Bradyrhizobium sp. TaxID=376 RepID=UPI003C247FB0